MARKKSFGSRIGNVLTTINSPTLRMGFSNIDKWISSGNYAMNRLWSGSFDKALLFGRNYIFYGESGSGKSLFSAVAAADAQKKHDAFVVWIDVEHANDDTAGHKWLQNAGIDTDEEAFLYTSASTLEEIKMIISKICVDYMDQQKGGNDEMPTIVFVVDSWAAALTATQWERTGGKEAGRVVGDQGQKAKQLGDVIASVTHLCAGLPIMVIGIQHIMDNQDGYGRKHKTTGGNKLLYYASGCIMLTKKELKLSDTDSKELKAEYAEREKTMLADVKKAAGGDKKLIGITATMEVIKSRVAKPFEKITIQIPYKTGIDPYSGLFDLLMQEGVIRKGSPGWFEYGDADSPTKFRKADFKDHADTLMQMADAIETSEEENGERE